ncbi:MAG: hypothetical protein ACKO0V_09230, partial [bacterium]
MSIDRRSRRQRSFQPSVGNLEERNLMSVGCGGQVVTWVKPTKLPIAQAAAFAGTGGNGGKGVMLATFADLLDLRTQGGNGGMGGLLSTSQGHTPITRLAGEWRSRTWITKVFADQFPDVPATIDSIDTVSRQGNKLVGTESVGTFTADWEITRTRQGLTMTVTTATRGSVELTGRRVGRNSWVFATDSTSAMPIRSVITILNRDTYSFANFQATPDGVQLLYTTVHERMKGVQSPLYNPAIRDFPDKPLPKP